MTGLVLMENAGRGAAEIIRERFGDPGSAIIFCGTGNNGGDGCVVARHLSNAGWRVRVVVCGDADRLTEDTAANLNIVRRMEIPIEVAPTGDEMDPAAASIRGDEVVIDALLGTGFRGEVRSPMDRLIRAINGAPKRAAAALDVPSGMDCDTGEASNSTIIADLTVTFVARKRGFTSEHAAKWLGEVRVAEIGAPASLIEEIASGPEKT